MSTMSTPALHRAPAFDGVRQGGDGAQASRASNLTP